MGPINGNARGINAELSAINPEVDSINFGVAEINRRAGIVIGLTTEIDNDLTNINNLVNSIEQSATEICQGVVTVFETTSNCP